MDTVALYELVCVNEFAPVDHFLRRTYINELSLSVYVYRMAYGNAFGTGNFLWKIEQFLSDHEEHNARV